MFVDASAIVAIIAREAEGTSLAGKLDAASEAYTSPIAAYESVLGLARALKVPLETAGDLVDDFIGDSEIRLLAMGAEVYHGAIEAFARYGKGRHRASLNLGDCFAYACAKSLGLPMLCKGDDFPHTDIQLA
jgi:ribonuclease VapC